MFRPPQCDARCRSLRDLPLDGGAVTAVLTVREEVMPTPRAARGSAVPAGLGRGLFEPDGVGEPDEPGGGFGFTVRFVGFVGLHGGYPKPTPDRLEL